MTTILDSYITTYGTNILNSLISYAGKGVNFVILLLVGYLFAYLISQIIKKILELGEVQKNIVRYGAMTSKLWLSITGFISQYLKWYLTIAVLTTTRISIVYQVFAFMSNLLWFFILLVIGLFLGGMAYKIIKQALENIGLEEELKRHKISNAFGGLTLSSILASIAKWYVVLIFLSTGIEQLLPVDSTTGQAPTLTIFTRNLMTYIPQAILGLLILIAALLISHFVSQRIIERKTPFSTILGMSAEAIIIFFGIVLALPKFGVENVDILEDAFRIISAGAALGLAIALGLGLKDPISEIAKKHV